MFAGKIKWITRLFVLFVITGFGLQPSFAKASDGPELPPQCSSIQVEEGNKPAFHVYARGVQIYRWNGQSWDFVAPRATLYAEDQYFGEVGTHYAGPKWESKSGSIVEGRRVQGTGCTPDPSAIAWLLLSKYDTSGAGIFASVTFVQRVNTTGGLTPTDFGTFVGEVKEVPYTAEYYFYKAAN
ncbi:MAG TPA: DUF3455 domain-containing protein [Pyrinomonadaceae bacterium]|nr:DUF3455 domain-containing protein [Pyrinomonadaceae bacterium]